MASADGNATPAKEQMDSAPSLCASGCGFFGNPSTGNMCSKCYKETIAKSAAAAPPAKAAEPPAAAPEPPVQHVAQEPVAVCAAPSPVAVMPDVSDAPSVSETVASAASTSAAPPSAASPPAPEPAASAAAVSGAVRPAEATEEEEQPPKKVQVNTSRCWTCNRKIGLLGFQCKCDYYFCAEHRYSDRHECAFDYKAQGKQQLSKANPTIAPSKMETM